MYASYSNNLLLELIKISVLITAFFFLIILTEIHTSSHARGNLFLGIQSKIWRYTAAKRTASHTSPQAMKFPRFTLVKHTWTICSLVTGTNFNDNVFKWPASNKVREAISSRRGKQAMKCSWAWRWLSRDSAGKDRAIYSGTGMWGFHAEPFIIPCWALLQCFLGSRLKRKKKKNMNFGWHVQCALKAGI